jgi:hypothetical protein
MLGQRDESISVNACMALLSKGMVIQGTSVFSLNAIRTVESTVLATSNLNWPF